MCRDIIVKDLNPGNVLLDGRGHLKLTYQCEWVSVERKLAPSALQGRYTAPEVCISQCWGSGSAWIRIIKRPPGSAWKIPTDS